MKLHAFLSIIAAAAMTAALSACSQESVSHDANTLPSKAHEVLARNFTSAISLVKEEKDFGSVSEYEVTLTDGSEVTFNSDGDWKSVETPNNIAVPAGIVPTAISNYVRQKHAGALIVGIEKNKKGYDVELSNGIDMQFDKTGNFVAYDK